MSWEHLPTNLRWMILCMSISCPMISMCYKMFTFFFLPSLLCWAGQNSEEIAKVLYTVNIAEVLMPRGHRIRPLCYTHSFSSVCPSEEKKWLLFTVSYVQLKSLLLAQKMALFYFSVEVRNLTNPLSWHWALLSICCFHKALHKVNPIICQDQITASGPFSMCKEYIAVK